VTGAGDPGAQDLLSFWLLHPSGRLEQMDHSTRNILEVLPNELIAHILAMLHYRDLASAMQVHLILPILLLRLS
jgi:hypothetical protein